MSTPSEINLTKRITTPQGTRFCPVVLAANGRIRPHWVIVNGNPEHHPEGNYYLDWTPSGGKRTRTSVGNDAAKAWNRRLHKQAELNALGQGIQLAADPGSRIPITLASSRFLEEVKLSLKQKSYDSYEQAMRHFLEATDKTYIDEIERRDMILFAGYLRDQKQLAPRTVANKFQVVMIFLKGQGKRGFLGRKDWPRYVLEEPEVYEREVVEKLFAACTDRERLLFRFFLMTGMRDQEVRHVVWRSVNLVEGTVSVRKHDRYHWTPKSWEERTIPMPLPLWDALKQAKGKAAADALLFPSQKNRPDNSFLNQLKLVAERAGFNPDDFILHRFRATFATWSLWEGTDLRTMQLWLGHKDLKSTMRYLKPNRNPAVRVQMNRTFQNY